MRILFLQNRLLFPPDTGGKIRTLNILRHLARWNEITYLCNLRPGEEEFIPAMRDLGVNVETVLRRDLTWGSSRFYLALAQNLLSPLPFNVAKHYDPLVHQRARALAANGRFDLLICDFLQTARYAFDLEGLPRILFQHNVEAQILRRHAETSPGWLRRRYMALQWHRMRRFEAATGRQFDTVIAVSEQDKALFEKDYDWRHVQTIDTGVDVAYFAPSQVPEHEDLVLFIGAMDWLPNQDGVRHFVHQVWPLILRARPAARFRIVGRNPSREMLSLATAPGVEVVGTVPDVRPYLAEASVVVVPLQVGGGTRLKIFEAMAMGKAVVSSTIGCEGLPVTAGAHLLVEDSPNPFADAVVQLLNNPARRTQLGAAARALVTQRYGSETVAQQFNHICQDTVEQWSESGVRRSLVSAG